MITWLKKERKKENFWEIFADRAAQLSLKRPPLKGAREFIKGTKPAPNAPWIRMPGVGH